MLNWKTIAFCMRVHGDLSNGYVSSMNYVLFYSNFMKGSCIDIHFSHHQNTINFSILCFRATSY